MRRTMAGTVAAALLTLLGVVGCASSNDNGGSAAIAMTPLAGKIGGQSWSLGTAETDSFLSDSTTFFVSMYSDTFTACTGSSTQENYFSPIIPNTPGDYPLNSQGFTATFVVGGSQNFFATSGHLVIDQVTSTTVTGGINASASSDNAIDGQFTLTVCP